jgi:hypothetical protein
VFGKEKNLMVVFINTILISGIFILIWCFYFYVKKTSALTDQIKREAKELRQQLKMNKPTHDHPKPDFRVVIEVVDPIALACRESKAARFVTDIAPVYLTREVYKQLQKEFTLAMKERGIDSNVTLISV